MKNKMKVINMELFNQNSSTIIDEVYEKNNTGFQDIAAKFLQVLKEDSQNKVQSVRQLITQQKLSFLTKAITFFLKRNLKTQQDEERHKNQYQTQKVLRQNLEKVTRRLSQAMAYIEHIKLRLSNKDSELSKKDQTIMILKKQSQIWKQKSKKSQIMKDWSESSMLLKTLQPTVSPYPRPEEIQVNYENISNKQNQNVFYRTLYETNRRNKELKRRKICTSSTDHKLKKKQQKRQFRKSSETFKLNTTTFKQKDHELIENSLLIAQKQINQVENKKSSSERWQKN